MKIHYRAPHNARDDAAALKSDLDLAIRVGRGDDDDAHVSWHPAGQFFVAVGGPNFDSYDFPTYPEALQAARDMAAGRFVEPPEYAEEAGATDARGRALPQLLIPGTERSARQAAQARAAKMTTKKAQKSAGGLFEQQERARDLFDRNPTRKKKPRRKITRLRRNAYEHGLESGRDLDFSTRMRIAKMRGGGEERYNRAASFRQQLGDDPLDTFSPKQRPIYRERKRRGLQVFRDDENILHPIRRSPGYDPGRAKHDSGFHPKGPKVQKVRRNPTRGAAMFRDEDQLERQVERMIDHLDRQFLSSNMTQATYDRKIKAINKWAAHQARNLRKTTLNRNPKRRTQSKRRAAPRPKARRVQTRPDNAANAVGAAAVRYRMAAMPVQRLVALHNRIAKRRRKSFDDVSVMTAAKIAAISKGASIKRPSIRK